MKTSVVLIGLLAASAVSSHAVPSVAARQGRPAGAKSCIDSPSIDSRRAEGDDTILFSVGSKTYRNRLRGVCPGLARLGNTAGLATELHGGQLCEGDTVRVFDRDAVRTTGIDTNPRCQLGWFEEVPKPLAR